MVKSLKKLLQNGAERTSEELLHHFRKDFLAHEHDQVAVANKTAVFKELLHKMCELDRRSRTWRLKQGE
jgi:hypothetical protein